MTFEDEMPYASPQAAYRITANQVELINPNNEQRKTNMNQIILPHKRKKHMVDNMMTYDENFPSTSLKRPIS